MATKPLLHHPEDIYSDVGHIILQVGDTYDFGRSTGNAGLRSGWSSPEDVHVWNDGYDAVLSLLIPKVSRPVKFTVEGEPFIIDESPIQEITIYANGYRIAFGKFSVRDQYSISATIYPFQILHSKDGGICEITFHLPNSVRPSEIVDSEDERQLGFCFRRLALA